jgi:hypothetical protein
MITQLLLTLAMLFGGLGLPIQIERVRDGQIFYGFGHATYYGTCTPPTGWAYAQDITLFERHLFTVVYTKDCAVAVQAG